MSKLRIDTLHIRLKGATAIQAHSLARQLGPHLLRALPELHANEARTIPDITVRAPSLIPSAIASSVARGIKRGRR